MTTDSTDIVQRAQAALAGITPGPWKIDEHDESALTSIVSVADDRLGGWVEVARSLGDDARFIAAAPDLVRELLAEVEKLRSEHTWPKTTPTGITYTAPETYAELCLHHDNAAQASVEGWEDSECPPEPTWEMVGLAHREVEKLTAEVEKLRSLCTGDVELAKASWRDIAGAAGIAWRDDDPSMVPRLIESIADLRAERDELCATVERVRDLVVWIDPGRCGGEPCVRGTRVWVSQVVDLLEDCTDEMIAGFYPTAKPWQVSILRALDGETP